MKIASAALLLAGSAAAFAPAAIPAPSSTRLASTVEKPAAEAAAPDRVAPDAGWEPDWEGRTGLPPEEFMQSDMAKPDLSGMWECPLTRWDSNG